MASRRKVGRSEKDPGVGRAGAQWRRAARGPPPRATHLESPPRGPPNEEADALFTGAARGYDAISDVLSYGQYREWQERLVDAARLAGIGPTSEVLDVATGTGKVAFRLAHTTGCHVVGLDLTRAMLRYAAGKRANHAAGSATHRGVVQGTADRLPFGDGRFDGLTFSYLYRYVDDPAATTRELVRVVRPGGFVGFIEFHVPPHVFWRQMWRLHTRIGLPAAGAVTGPGWFRVGRFLGPSIERFWRAWDLDAIGAMLRAAGLVDVQHETLSLGGGVVFWGRKGTEA